MFRSQTIATWASDFQETAAYEELPAPAKEYAQEVLPAFQRACAERDVEPQDVIESDRKPALLEGIGELPASVRAAVPDLCASFLQELEAQGPPCRGTDARPLRPRAARGVRGALFAETAAQPRRQDRPQRAVPLRQRPQVQELR
jgi:hypothetical protein